jgi:hypothetical protein
MGRGHFCFPAPLQGAGVLFDIFSGDVIPG